MIVTIEDALKGCYITSGNIVKVPEEQIDRKVYIELKKRMELIGGVWKSGKTFGFVFKNDPSALLQSIQNGDKRNLQQETQSFFTPESIAREMVVELLMCTAIKDGDMFLEPSAGQGALIDAVLRIAGDAKIDIFAVEKNSTNQIVLNEKYRGIPETVHIMHPLNDDFLNISNETTLGEGTKQVHHAQFDYIIANPPFKSNQDIDHIELMYKLLKPGGRMVTLSSTHWIASTNKKEVAFKEWVWENAQDITRVGNGAFKESGTSVDVLRIIIDKPIS